MIIILNHKETINIIEMIANMEIVTTNIIIDKKIAKTIDITINLETVIINATINKEINLIITLTAIITKIIDKITMEGNLLTKRESKKILKTLWHQT